MIYSTLINKALELATEAHAEQFDKAGQSYILHPFYVASQFNTEDEIIVSLLHDILEDTSVSIQKIMECGFSDEVINALLILTKRSYEVYSKYIQRVARNKLATKVKIQDLKHNLDDSRLHGSNKSIDPQLKIRYIDALKNLEEKTF